MAGQQNSLESNFKEGSKIVLYFLLSFSIIAFTGCTEKFLEVDPPDGLNQENFYKTEEQMISALVSAYDVMHWPEFYGRDYFLILDVASDDCKGEYPGWTFDNFSFSNSDLRIYHLWEIFYRGIFRCNTVLERIPESLPEKFVKQVKAEAKFLRAFYYWHVVTVFGQAPLLLNVLAPDELAQPKVTQEKIWTQIEKDLIEAIPDLPLRSEYNSSQFGRATQGAAQALLGKSYLYQQKYDLAKLQFESVINSNQYQLIQAVQKDSLSYYNAFLSIFTEEPFGGYGGQDVLLGGENNIESLFEVQFFDYESFNQWLGWGNAGSERAQYLNSQIISGYRNMVPDVSLVNSFHPSDPRLAASVWRSGDTLDFRPGTKLYNVQFVPFTDSMKDFSGMAIYTGYLIKKTVYPLWYKGYLYGNNYPIIRYADVLLMYAEVLYHLRQGDPYEYINLVRNRVGLPPTNQSLPNAFIQERRWELCFENQRFNDLIRWTKCGCISNVQNYIPEFTSGKNEYFPIPQTEIEMSEGALIQNPNY